MFGLMVTRTITGRRGTGAASSGLSASKATKAMTEAHLFLLRRAATVGHLSLVTVEERAALDELIAMKLVLGNQLTEAGWRQLRKARGSLEGLIPFASPQPDALTA
jgi:hypothetical protein